MNENDNEGLEANDLQYEDQSSLKKARPNMFS
jgi:hypothetical protein